MRILVRACARSSEAGLPNLGVAGSNSARCANKTKHLADYSGPLKLVNTPQFDEARCCGCSESARAVPFTPLRPWRCAFALARDRCAALGWFGCAYPVEPPGYPPGTGGHARMCGGQGMPLGTNCPMKISQRQSRDRT